MSACDRTYMRYVCKKNSYLSATFCLQETGFKYPDDKYRQYVDEITGEVCSEELYDMCSCDA